MREHERIAALRDRVAQRAGAESSSVRVIRSPYRICPLGAHVDHQLGEVTGMALDRALLFGFVPRADAVVRVESSNFPGSVEFTVHGVPEHPAGDWGDYARGAAFALRQRGHDVRRGLFGIVDGYDNVGGLSSSAAVGVAYLLAMESASDLEVTSQENIELDRIIENEYIGLNNGLLDQSTILLSRCGRLMYLDCESGRTALYECGAPADVHVVVLYSGLRGQLAQTSYNRRVAECQEAARMLLLAAGRVAGPEAKLRHVPAEAFELFKGVLPHRLRRRAEHFFSEQRRVRAGVRLWQAGNLAGFGRLISESGRSSIENYQCGNAYLRTACNVLWESPGVLGARFSGAGFRGCSIGLLAGPPPPELAPDILSRYLKARPDMRGRAEVVICRTGDGACLLAAN